MTEQDSLQELIRKLPRLANAQPNLILSILLDLLNLLVDKNILKKEEIEPFLIASIKRWSE